MHLQLFNEKRLSLQQKTRSYINSFPSGALIAVITAPELKETLTPAKFDGAVFKHLTIANHTHTHTHTQAIGKACHQSTNNFHLFFCDLGEPLHENIRWSFFLGCCVQKLAGAVLYALHLQKFQSYSLEAMNHHDGRRVYENIPFLEHISFQRTNPNISTYLTTHSLCPYPITTNNSMYLLLVLDTTTH